jgi:hypothetical protein
MSINPHLRKAMDIGRADLFKASEEHLSSDSPRRRMKARFMFAVTIPYMDWFEDEADKQDIAGVAQCAAEGLGYIVALLASTAGDSAMEEHAALIMETIALQIGKCLSTNNE